MNAKFKELEVQLNRIFDDYPYLDYDYYSQLMDYLHFVKNDTKSGSFQTFCKHFQSLVNDDLFRSDFMPLFFQFWISSISVSSSKFQVSPFFEKKDEIVRKACPISEFILNSYFTDYSPLLLLYSLISKTHKYPTKNFLIISANSNELVSQNISYSDIDTLKNNWKHSSKSMYVLLTFQESYEVFKWFEENDKSFFEYTSIILDRADYDDQNTLLMIMLLNDLCSKIHNFSLTLLCESTHSHIHDYIQIHQSISVSDKSPPLRTQHISSESYLIPALIKTLTSVMSQSIHSKNDIICFFPFNDLITDLISQLQDHSLYKVGNLIDKTPSSDYLSEISTICCQHRLFIPICINDNSSFVEFPENSTLIFFVCNEIDYSLFDKEYYIIDLGSYVDYEFSDDALFGQPVIKRSPRFLIQNRKSINKNQFKFPIHYFVLDYLPQGEYYEKFIIRDILNFLREGISFQYLSKLPGLNQKDVLSRVFHLLERFGLIDSTKNLTQFGRQFTIIEGINPIFTCILNIYYQDHDQSIGSGLFAGLMFLLLQNQLFDNLHSIQLKINYCPQSDYVTYIKTINYVFEQYLNDRDSENTLFDAGMSIHRFNEIISTFSTISFMFEEDNSHNISEFLQWISKQDLLTLIEEFLSIISSSLPQYIHHHQSIFVSSDFKTATYQNENGFVFLDKRPGSENIEYPRNCFIGLITRFDHHKSYGSSIHIFQNSNDPSVVSLNIDPYCAYPLFESMFKLISDDISRHLERFDNPSYYLIHKMQSKYFLVFCPKRKTGIEYIKKNISIISSIMPYSPRSILLLIQSLDIIGEVYSYGAGKSETMLYLPTDAQAKIPYCIDKSMILYLSQHQQDLMPIDSPIHIGLTGERMSYSLESSNNPPDFENVKFSDKYVFGEHDSNLVVLIDPNYSQPPCKKLQWIYKQTQPNQSNQPNPSPTHNSNDNIYRFMSSKSNVRQLLITPKKYSIEIDSKIDLRNIISFDKIHKSVDAEKRLIELGIIEIYERVFHYNSQKEITQLYIPFPTLNDLHIRSSSNESPPHIDHMSIILSDLLTIPISSLYIKKVPRDGFLITLPSSLSYDPSTISKTIQDSYQENGYPCICHLLSVDEIHISITQKMISSDSDLLENIDHIIEQFGFTILSTTKNIQDRFIYCNYCIRIQSRFFSHFQNKINQLFKPDTHIDQSKQIFRIPSRLIHPSLLDHIPTQQYLLSESGANDVYFYSPDVYCSEDNYHKLVTYLTSKDNLFLEDSPFIHTRISDSSSTQEYEVNNYNNEFKRPYIRNKLRDILKCEDFEESLIEWYLFYLDDFPYSISEESFHFNQRKDLHQQLDTQHQDKLWYFSRRFNEIIIPRNCFSKAEQLSTVTEQEIEVNGCILGCENPRKSKLMLAEYDHDQVHCSPLCVTCWQSSYEDSLERFIKSDVFDWKLARSNELDIQNILNISSKEEGHSKIFWPQIPLGQLLMVTMNENDRMKFLTRSWISSKIGSLLHRSPQIIAFCPDHSDCFIVRPINNPNADIQCPKCQKLECPRCHNWHLRGKCPKDQLVWNGKFCPKCHIPFEKDGGCNHITCRCNAHWCYLCADKDYGSAPPVYAHLNAVHGGYYG